MFKTQLRAARSGREDKLKVSDSHRTTFNCLQASFGQQRNNILSANMPVGTVKVRKNASLLIAESLEVNDKYTSLGLEDSSNLSYAL
jgi:hypothetical protein